MTRKPIFLLTLAFALSSFVFSQAAGTAAATKATAPATSANVPTGPAPTKVGVIDIQAAIFNTNEGRRDIETLAKKFDPRRAELNALNDDIENLKKQLTAQQDKLNDEERATRVRAIEQKQKNLQRLGEDAQADFQTQQNEFVNRIGQKMLEVLKKYAETNNLAVVIDASNQTAGVLYASEQVNITPAIINGYNAQSPVPAQPAGASGVPAPSRQGTKPASPSTTRKPATGTTTPPRQ